MSWYAPKLESPSEGAMHHWPSFIIAHRHFPVFLFPLSLTSVPSTRQKSTHHFTFFPLNPSRLISALSKLEVKAGGTPRVPPLPLNMVVGNEAFRAGGAFLSVLPRPLRSHYVLNLMLAGC